MSDPLTVLVVALEQELREALAGLLETDARYRVETHATLTEGVPPRRPDAVVLFLSPKATHRTRAEVDSVERTFAGVPLVVIDGTPAQMTMDAPTGPRVRWLHRMPDTPELLDAIAAVARR